MSGLHISLLGPFQAELDGRPLTSFRTSKVQALLIYLLVEAAQHPEKDVGREQAMTLLWPEAPRKSAQDNLRQTLYQLRKTIPDLAGVNGDPIPFILSDRQKISVNPDAYYQLDVAIFTRLIEEGGPEQLRHAANLYRGAFLADFYLRDSNEFEMWAARHRSRLQWQVLGALERLAAHHLERWQAEEAAAYARRALAIDEARENAHRHLMAALEQMGRRAEALQQYERCRTVLQEGLGVAPSADTEALARAIRRGDGAGKRRGRLPLPETPVIGREIELAEIAGLLRGDARLVSIVGPGGIGKTRLALEVASSIETASSRKLIGKIERVCFVNLAPLSAAEEVAPAVARALGMAFDKGRRDRLRQRLLAFLENKDLLLVLDNFEHLLEEASLVREILRAAPRVKLLVTSRERLRLRAEHVYPLSGLAYSQWTTPAEASRDPAVRLFLQQAQRVRPAFRLRKRHSHPLWEIVRLTEGMPLALILAAGWVNVLGPEEIADELNRGLDFLQATHRDVPPRQRSMRAVFDATWHRLSEGARAIFAALSVFRGGFTLEAAQAVAGATAADLMRLADCSLVTRGEDGRFEVHELLRQFAGERLVKRGKSDAVRDAHSNYYLTVLVGHLPDLKGAAQLDAVDAIEEEFENIRAAWRRATQCCQWARLAKASECLYLFSLLRNRYLDGIELMETVCRAISASTTGAEPRAWAIITAGWLSLLEEAGLIHEATGVVGELQAVAEGLAEPQVAAYCHLALGAILRAGGSNSEAIEQLERALACYRQEGDSFYAALASFQLGWARYKNGQAEQAIRLQNDGLALARRTGDHYVTAELLRSVGAMIWMFEGLTEAVERYQMEAAKLQQEIGAQAAYAYNLSQLANMPVWREGDLTKARPLLDEALAIAEEQNVPNLTAHVLAEETTLRLIGGHYQQALALTEKVLTLAPSELSTWTWASFQRGIAFLALGDVADAIRYMKLPLSRMVEEDWSGMLRTFLPFLGIILAEWGEHEWAAELFAFGLTDPYTPGRLQVDPLITRFRAELEEELGEEPFAAAWERGKQLDTLTAGLEVLKILDRAEA